MCGQRIQRLLSSRRLYRTALRLTESLGRERHLALRLSEMAGRNRLTPFCLVGRGLLNAGRRSALLVERLVIARRHFARECSALTRSTTVNGAMNSPAIM